MLSGIHILPVLVLLASIKSAVGKVLTTPTIQPRGTPTAGAPIGGGYIFTTGVPGCTSGSVTGGAFTYTWTGGDYYNSICGKGWSTGTNRTIGYSGTFYPNGNSFVSVYGWTRNPLIEYYVVEAFAWYNPSSAASKRGIVTCNDRVYDVLQTTRYNQPSIDGTQTFQQLWSVRQSAQITGAINGTIDMACHFKAWEALASAKLGTHNYQLLGVDAYFSSGTATITIANYSVPW